MNDCSFCLSKNLQNAIDVKLLDLDDNEFGKVSYMEMLVDVLPTADFQVSSSNFTNQLQIRYFRSA